MSFVIAMLLGIAGGAAPALMARPSLRSSIARQWWRLIFGVLIVCIVIPNGLVLLMFLSEGAYDAIDEMGTLLVDSDFGWIIALMLGSVVGSGVMALRLRQSPQLQDQPSTVPARQREDDPIRSMYVGFGAAWYCAISVCYALTFRSQTNHFLTGLALFVFVPAMFGGFCGVCGSVIRTQTKIALNAALSRRFAMIVGLFVGVLSIAAVGGVCWAVYSWRHDEVGVIAILAGVGAVLVLMPFLGLWLLNLRAARIS
jgi:hypothetical protein